MVTHTPSDYLVKVNQPRRVLILAHCSNFHQLVRKNSLSHATYFSSILSFHPPSRLIPAHCGPHRLKVRQDENFNSSLPTPAQNGTIVRHIKAPSDTEYTRATTVGYRPSLPLRVFLVACVCAQTWQGMDIRIEGRDRKEDIYIYIYTVVHKYAKLIVDLS